MAALSDHEDSLPVTYDSESQDEIPIPSLTGGPSEEVEMEESGDGDESSSRKREREDEEEQEAESAQSDIPDEPELKKQRTEEVEEEEKKHKYAWLEFLENAKVGSDKPYGIGVRNIFEDKKNHTTYVELPPAVVGRGKDGQAPF